MSKDNLTLLKKIKLLKELRSEISSIDSSTVGINYFIELYKYIIGNCIKYFQFMNFSDSRGRFYIKSPVSIQSNWLYRYIYHLGEIGYDDYIKYIPVVLEPIDAEVSKKLNSVGLYDLHISNVLLSIGLIFKSKVDDVGGFRTFKDTILLGLDIYLKHNNVERYKYSIDNILMIEYYINIINNVKIKKVKK